MLVSEVRQLQPKDRFLYWVQERRGIRFRKSVPGSVKPWTNDEILQSYYFTNVEREHDKVTIWFRENIREPLKDKPEVVFATIAFRWFNLPQPSGEYLCSHGYLTDWNLPKVVAGLTEFKNRGLQVFTGAFNISNSGSTKPKIERVCQDYIQPVWVQRERIYQEIGKIPTMAHAFSVIRSLPGLGGSGFMAAQVICDLAYTHVLGNAPDWWTWCSWGPGSKRGMNRLLGRPEDSPISKSEWYTNEECLRHELKSLGINLHARDVQNCLCEFSKYERALWNQGHLKRRYPGHA